MLRHTTLPSCLALVFALTHARAADWTQFRGPTGSGVSAETGLSSKWSAKENVAWKTEMPGPGTSSPVFFGDRIFITCYTGYNVPGRAKAEQVDLRRHLLALDRKTGRVLMNKEVEAKLPEQDKIRDTHGYASSTPAVDADRVYCFFGKSGVFAFDHAGKQLWQADVGTKLSDWGSAASPVLHGDLVIVNASVESQTLFAFDKKTGKEKWKVAGIKESWNTPLVVKTKDGKDELVVAIMGKVLGFDPATGAALWSCDTDITWYMVPSLVAHDGIVYALGGRSGIAALAVRAGGTGNVTKTHRLWTSKKGANVPSPVLHDGHLYWMNEVSGTVFCAKAATGEVVYEERVPRPGDIYASSLLADGRLHYLSRDGRTFVVAAKPEYELIATNDLRDGSLFHATPVAADGRLFIRSDKYLYCLGK
ncbi:PQQ-binding-like beta-propeller repeat protein [Gemmata sp. G18]|uniref:PQQ-binding-like beta-propeller repeat protein n=1 Tax=Gemmata palustris TaxID=2822762 RepID=A0ABS5C4S2_9BACT|nr:PQQ-binding-like beta-propeller repeat protein [Gemmata palustris]MBP3961016.1 PQQ-binding-like beta-propeller repeat protein [Gemmata palustris]